MKLPDDDEKVIECRRLLLQSKVYERALKKLRKDKPWDKFDAIMKYTLFKPCIFVCFTNIFQIEYCSVIIIESIAKEIDIISFLGRKPGSKIQKINKP